MKNKNKILKAIDTGANLQGHNCHGSELRCVVGSLLEHAGYDMERLERESLELGEAVDHLPADAKQLLLEEYGLDESTLLRLQAINDNTGDTPLRRANLTKAICNLEKMDEQQQ